MHHQRESQNPQPNLKLQRKRLARTFLKYSGFLFQFQYCHGGMHLHLFHECRASRQSINSGLRFYNNSTEDTKKFATVRVPELWQTQERKPNEDGWPAGSWKSNCRFLDGIFCWTAPYPWQLPKFKMARISNKRNHWDYQMCKGVCLTGSREFIETIRCVRTCVWQDHLLNTLLHKMEVQWMESSTKKNWPTWLPTAGI